MVIMVWKERVVRSCRKQADVILVRLVSARGYRRCRLLRTEREQSMALAQVLHRERHVLQRDLRVDHEVAALSLRTNTGSRNDITASVTRWREGMWKGHPRHLSPFALASSEFNQGPFLQPHQ